MSLTPAQQQAITARGNVLVVAGAGTGKTRTLVERCLDCLLREEGPVGLDQLLIVTFTEAAAAEVRQRIRTRLEQEAARNPQQWQEQLALFDTAHIGTLHSFCLQLVRQHFYELGLDPQLSVVAEEEGRLLADETLDKLLQAHYEGRDAAARAVQKLIQAQGRGSDRPIRALVLRLHHYSQTLPDPEAWLAAQEVAFASPQPQLWQRWLNEALISWRKTSLADLEPLVGANSVAAECAGILKKLAPTPSKQQAALALQRLLDAKDNGSHGKKNGGLKPLKQFFDEVEFLASLLQPESATSKGAADAEEAGTADLLDPLMQDWTWVRSEMLTLLGLARQFTTDFTEAKRELGVVDFHDLEQYALRLLWDNKLNQPTEVARQWQQQLRFIFVDEYQDINAAQDKLVEALSRPGERANCFLVGDIKQSIYRFRLANPHIFQRYAQQWNGDAGQVIPLVENFRSREGILNFVNALFSQVMQPELGGVTYNEQARLRFGAPEQRQALSAAAGQGPCVELHLRLKTNNGAVEAADLESPEELSEVAQLEEAAKEARLVGLRLAELRASQHPVWDETINGFRPVQWADMALLLRAPAAKADSYAKEFSRLGIPLQVARGGFYRSSEIADLLSLLQLLDNPLQDLPAIAVLRSPLVGLTLNELANIRLALLKARYWTALQRWFKGEQAKASQGTTPAGSAVEDTRSTYAKVSSFLERFSRWRRLVRQASLSRCLEAVLAETRYADWLLTQPRGEQRQANIQRLLLLTEQFDQFQRQGLFRFLRFIDGQQQAESEPEVAAVSPQDAVRLMSIHQSKGLEFPVVVVADLGKPFNLSDLRAPLILDEEYGLCPQIKPPQTGKRYPSLPYWLARRRELRELLGEELRLLYVAMTRARDTLVLTGSISRTKFEKMWLEPAPSGPAQCLAARSYADWLGLWLGQEFGGAASSSPPRQGQKALLRWTAYEDDAALVLEPAGLAQPTQPVDDFDFDSPDWKALQQRLSGVYPFAAATRQPAKTSVSALRRQAASEDGEAADAFSWSQFPVRLQSHLPRAGSKLSAAETGTAHHAFLRLVTLEQTHSVAALRQEAERLRSLGALDAAAVDCLDFKALAGFWSSDLGRKIRAQAQFIRRELPFTARFEPAELAQLTGTEPDPSLAGEFVVVQGVADLAVLLPTEIWLLDFKTDELASDDLEEKTRLYTPQLQLYALALSRIYGRPVTHCWLYFLSRNRAQTVPGFTPATQKASAPST